ncbi:MAG: ABC transporter ATP-binding protein, partial [Selenomonas sp.]|nr:ABC transporter ATP-binding protein [Selenomonas sp.]
MSETMRLMAEHLSFAYRAERRILDDVSLSVAPGEVLGLLGPNGTGKTTLIKCIAQLLRPSAGTVRVDGTDLAALSAGEIARRIAYVPQYTNAAFGMTTLQAVLMGRLPYAG